MPKPVANKPAQRPTLLFLLITLPIAFILLSTALIIIFSGKARIEKKRIQAEKEIGDYAAALTVFHQDTGQYPSTAQGLVALMAPPFLEPIGDAIWPAATSATRRYARRRNDAAASRPRALT